VDQQSDDESSDGDVSIRLRGVTKSFPGASAPAVAPLDLDVPRGEIVVLIGPSGCGKTTTLRMINRLIEPTAGTITIEGADIRQQSPTELRRDIGYVIQQIGLFPHRTIAQNIATVPKLLGWNKAKVSARVEELVDLVGLDHDMMGRYPSELSGGQQQRVGVARALAADPPALLMDEPFGAVDPIVRGRLQGELIALQQRVRKTIVLVTHDIDEAIRVGDRIALLNIGGVLEQFGPPDDLLAHPANPFVEQFLGSERSLKRLALLRVRDLPSERGPVVDVATSIDEARKVAAEVGGGWVGVIDGDRFRGWAEGETLIDTRSLADQQFEPPAVELDPDATLRETLEAILTSRSSVAVVAEDGRFGGVVTLEQIRRGLLA
jgi:osmoprotectant transport system ATP-binding protein